MNLVFLLNIFVKIQIVHYILGKYGEDSKIIQKKFNLIKLYRYSCNIWTTLVAKFRIHRELAISIMKNLTTDEVLEIMDERRRQNLEKHMYEEKQFKVKELEL